MKLQKILSLGLAGACLAGTLHSATAGAFEDFFLALRDNKPAAIRTLLERGMDPNTPDEGGEPALVRALRVDAFDVAEVLMSRPHIDLNRANLQGENALMIAAFKGRKDLVEKLLARKAEVNKTGWTPLHYAASVGNNAIVALLIEHSAYVDAESPNGTTPIMMAARGGHIATVRLLIDEGADLSLKNEQGMTVIDFAERHEQKDIAEGLRLRAKREAERRAKPWR